MAEHIIKKGLDLPISGKPAQSIHEGPQVKHIAVLGHDYPGMKPRMHVQVGDQVKRGQLLFEDRKAEGVCFTAPGAGEVVAIHRGEKRLFLSIVIRLSESEASGQPTDADFAPIEAKVAKAAQLDGDGVRGLLAETGLWTSLRTRPFDAVPSPSENCQAIFVTAVDSNPLSAAPEIVLQGKEAAFVEGLHALSKLGAGKIFLCVGPEWRLDIKDAPVEKHTFSGPHPSGLVGTHIHTLMPAHRERTVWHIGYQDVAAIGELLLTGKLPAERTVALGGPMVSSPRLLKTRVGASISELTEGELKTGEEIRLVSGSVFFGQMANGEEVGFLNRYPNQVTALAEDRERVLFGWLAPGSDKFSTIRAFVSKLMPQKEYDFTTTTHGSHRAMVPIGMFERVMPLDIMPTFLLRSLLMNDLERAEQLGCLELHEEDLALCSFVSPGKEDYGKALRRVLTDIRREG